MKSTAFATILAATTVLFASSLQAREIACPSAKAMVNYFKKDKAKRWKVTSGTKEFWGKDTDKIYFHSAMLVQGDKKNSRHLKCRYINTQNKNYNNITRNKEYTSTCKFKVVKPPQTKPSQCEAIRTDCILTGCS